MRISEALALQLDDMTADGLIIRQTKFQKNRLLPLHPTTRGALDRYLAARRRVGTLNSALFVSCTGAPPAYSTVIAVFLRLARLAGLRGEPVKSDLAFMISGTPSPYALWSDASMTAMLAVISPPSAPIWATLMSLTPTGIYTRRRY
nr:tyrosine-type recombinase/integrase [Sinorhizobium sp. 7-81]